MTRAATPIFAQDVGQITTTTCYMCACRCGIDVHLKDGKIRYIEGNRDHPVNRGVLCAKGSAGIMQHYSPARLRAAAAAGRPARLRRIPRDRLGRGAATAPPAGCGDVRNTDPKQARLLHRPRPVAGADRLVGAAVRHAELRRAWRLLLGQHGGGRHLHDRRLVLGIRRARLGRTPSSSCCSASPRTTIPIRSRSASASSRRAARKIVSVNPVRTGYSAIADDWIGIRPGTDGLFVVRADPRAAARPARSTSTISCATPMRHGW